MDHNDDSRRRLAKRGLWYPHDTGDLMALMGMEPREPGTGWAAVLPHSGLWYTAPMLTGFFKQLPESVDSLLILSPSHHFPLLPDSAVTWGYSSAETPFGDVEVFDPGLATSYAKDPLAAEHGIEMFLPYAGLLGLRVSFLLLGPFSCHDSALLFSEKLAKAVRPGLAVVASSDFTHYGDDFNNKPWHEMVAERKALERDANACDLARIGRTETLLREYSGGPDICGLAGVVALSGAMAKLGVPGRLASQATTNDALDGRGESSRFISFASVIWG